MRPKVGDEVVLHDLLVAAIGLWRHGGLGVGEPLGQVVPHRHMTLRLRTPHSPAREAGEPVRPQLPSATHARCGRSSGAYRSRPAEIDGDTPAIRTTMFDVTAHVPAPSPSPVAAAGSVFLGGLVGEMHRGRGSVGYLRFFSSSDEGASAYAGRDREWPRVHPGTRTEAPRRGTGMHPGHATARGFSSCSSSSDEHAKRDDERADLRRRHVRRRGARIEIRIDGSQGTQDFQNSV